MPPARSLLTPAANLLPRRCMHLQWAWCLNELFREVQFRQRTMWGHFADTIAKMYYYVLSFKQMCFENQQNLMPHLSPVWSDDNQIYDWADQEILFRSSDRPWLQNNVRRMRHKLKLWRIPPHAAFKVKWLRRNLQRSETSLQSDRIKSERNWVKYVIIEIYIFTV